MDDSGKVALVTGANRGIGFEIARQLAKLGHHVIVGSRASESGKRATEKIASERIKKEVKSTELDVTDEATVAVTKNMIEAEFGRLDILVNNAAILVDDSNLPSSTSLIQARSTLEVNLIGVWRMCETFIPGMKERHYSRIVNVSSGAGSFEDL